MSAGERWSCVAVGDRRILRMTAITTLYIENWFQPVVNHKSKLFRGKIAVSLKPNCEYLTCNDGEKLETKRAQKTDLDFHQFS